MYHTDCETLKARKPHRCMSCGEAIAVGETYKRWRTYDGGYAGTNKMHPECLAMHQADAARFGDNEWEYSTYGHERPKPEDRACTCHPDDNPPQPCAKRYALAECKAAHAAGPAALPKASLSNDGLGGCIRSEEAMAKEEYTRIDVWPAGDAYKAMRCACCGGAPEAWQFVTVSDQVQRVVMCETVDLERDEEEHCLVDGGCPFSMPPARFYCGTLREAVRMWNHVNGLLVAKRQENALPSPQAA